MQYWIKGVLHFRVSTCKLKLECHLKSDFQPGKTSTTLTKPDLKIQYGNSHVNSAKAVVVYCLLAVLQCFNKTGVYTALSNFLLWTCCYSVGMHKIPL